MIAKNIKGQSFSGCVKYVIKEGAKVLKAEGVMTIDNDTIINSFEFQRSCRSEIKSPVGHIPLAFAPEDKERMTNDFMVQLAEEYMQNMGIKDTQYIIVRHNDTAHEHVHIVYNRIDNNRKLISDKNDYKRNVATCKRLKDKYNLTYGKDKSRVNRQKLRGTEKTKHQIFDAVKAEITRSKSINELSENLKAYGVSIELKYRKNSDIIEGISFCKGQHKFKGSQIDRKYSYNGLLKILEQQRPKHTIKGAPLTDKQYEDLMNCKKLWITGMTDDNGKKFSTFVQVTPDKKMVKYSNKRIPIIIGGIEMSEQQRITLDDGKAIWLEGIRDNEGKIYNSYLKYSNKIQKLKFYKQNPDRVQETTSTPQYQQQLQEQTSHHQDISTSSSIGLFDLPTNGDDNEEDVFRKRMQQKRKRGFRL